MNATAVRAADNISYFHPRPGWTRYATPNRITFLRGVMLLPVANAILSHHQWLAINLYISTSLLDALDGWVARRYRLTTALGAWLDPFVDKCFGISGLILTVFSSHSIMERSSLNVSIKTMVVAYITLEALLLGIRPLKRYFSQRWRSRIEQRSNGFGKLKVWAIASTTVAFLIPTTRPWAITVGTMALAIGLISGLLSLVYHVEDILGSRPVARPMTPKISA